MTIYISQHNGPVYKMKNLSHLIQKQRVVITLKINFSFFIMVKISLFPVMRNFTHWKSRSWKFLTKIFKLSHRPSKLLNVSMRYAEYNFVKKIYNDKWRCNVHCSGNAIYNGKAIYKGDSTSSLVIGG